MNEPSRDDTKRDQLPHGYQMIQQRVQCVWCSGDGKRNKRDCTACRGLGDMSVDRWIELWAQLFKEQAERIAVLSAQVQSLRSERREDLTGSSANDEIIDFLNRGARRRSY